MNKQHGQNQKQDIINRYFSGEGVTTLSEETGVSRSTIYNWLKVERQLREKKAAEKETYNFKSYSQLKEHVERLEGMLAILKTCGCAPHDPLPVKLKVSERLYHEDNYSVRMICEALDVPRGTFYNHVLRNKRGESSYEKRPVWFCYSVVREHLLLCSRLASCLPPLSAEIKKRSLCMYRSIHTKRPLNFC